MYFKVLLNAKISASGTFVSVTLKSRSNYVLPNTCNIHSCIVGIASAGMTFAIDVLMQVEAIGEHVKMHLSLRSGA